MDGVSKQSDGLDNWKLESTVVLPNKFKVLALKGVHHGGWQGILASVEDSSGTIVLKTDNSWKCSTEFEEGWEQIDFDMTSGNWQPALERGNHGMHPWGYIGQISHSAKWIWATDYKDTEIYCRTVYRGKQQVVQTTIICMS